MSKKNDNPDEQPSYFWNDVHKDAGITDEKAVEGRPRIFTTPGLLKAAADEYFVKTAQRFWKDQKHSGGKIVDLKISPPFSLSGFRLYVRASENWWSEFRKARKAANDTEFLEVINYIEDVISTQQWEGATIGAFNANIISRTLGLVDKKETEVKATVFKVGYKKHEDDGDGN